MSEMVTTMRHDMTRTVISVIGIVAATSIAVGQQPRFGARVEVVLVDANVVDDSGRPIEGLQAPDFSVSVDGKPRHVASVSFVRDGAASPVPQTAPGRTAGPQKTPNVLFSTNEGSQAGRLILLVIDQDNIHAGGGRAAIESAQRFIDALQPSDRVGLIAIPTGPRVEMTGDHDKVRAVLGNVTGHEAPVTVGTNVGLSEAFGIEQGDRDALGRAVARECVGLTGRALDACEAEVDSAGRTVAITARQRTRASLESIRQVLISLARIEGPKTVVLISESLVTGGSSSDLTESAGRLEDIARECAAARVTMFALRLERPLVDMSRSGAPPTAALDRQLQAEGLQSLVTAARGTLFNVVGAGEGIFNRIILELSAHYLIGFEAETSDRDGRPHRIDVKTTRRGVHLRSRRDFVYTPAASETDEAALGRALASPFLATDIPVRVTTYAMRHPENSKIRLVISADIGREVEAPQQMSVAFVVYDRNGKVVTSALQRNSLAPKHVPGAVGYVASTSLEPGDYRVRLAVRDADGRTGSVEHRASAHLTDIPRMQVSDLVLADEDPSQPGKWEPSVGGRATGAMSAYLELYSGDKEALGNATVRVEVAENEDAPALVTGEARAAGPPEKGRREVTARVGLDLLPPGSYVARALVAVGGRTLGRVARAFVVAPTPGGQAVGPPPVRVTPFSDLARAFDVRQVLDPRVLTPFLDRLTAAGAPPVSAPVREAIARAKRGAFDDVDKLPNERDLAATFVHGLALLARKDLERAAGDFRAALRLSSDFFPAAFYLGACYAAGGRGREAVGAWQTTLAGESTLEVAYLMSFDALARLGDWPQALDVARDARAQWPADPELQRRVVAASVMTDADDDALPILRDYLQHYSNDQEALFLAMRLMVTSRLSGDADGDRMDIGEFNRYADLYSKGNGPRQPLVALWQRYLAGR